MIILLMGPTAAGKTDLAIEFAKRIPSEIISVDSAMVYRGMDIGTGKPSAEQLNTVTHHLIDIRDPSEPYSAAEFRNDALKLIPDIQSRNRIPLLVGGTLLYFRSLLEGLSPLPSADPLIRAKLLKEAETLGWKAMHDRLMLVDPTAAQKIHPNDPQRIQRALEVYELTGEPMSSFWQRSADDHFLDQAHTKIINFAIMPKDRTLLHERIKRRFHEMLERGLMAEAESLYQRIQNQELDLSLPAMRAVGYRQLFHYLAGEYGYEEMVSRAIAATRQLAKRQLTWLRSLSNSKNNLSMDFHGLDLENNHFDSLKTMIHCVT